MFFHGLYDLWHFQEVIFFAQVSQSRAIAIRKMLYEIDLQKGIRCDTLSPPGGISQDRATAYAE